MILKQWDFYHDNINYIYMQKVWNCIFTAHLADTSMHTMFLPDYHSIIKLFIYIYGDMVSYLEFWFNYVSSWRLSGYVEGFI